MFFVVILAALLYLYRLFRKQGAQVTSRFLPASSAAGVSPGQGVSLLERIVAAHEGSDSAHGGALWGQGESSPSSWTLLIRSSLDVARNAHALNLPRGCYVALVPSSPLPILTAMACELGLSHAGLVLRPQQASATPLLVESLLDPSSSNLPSPPTPGPHEAAIYVSDVLVSHLQLQQLLDTLVTPRLSWRDSAAFGGSGDCSRIAALAALQAGAPVVARAALSECEATLIGLQGGKDGLRALASSIRKQMASWWLGSWACGIAESAGSAASTGSLSFLATLMLQVKLVVADVLFFPRSLRPFLGPRCVHILHNLSQEDQKQSQTDQDLLRGLGINLIHLGAKLRSAKQ